MQKWSRLKLFGGYDGARPTAERVEERKERKKTAPHDLSSSKNKNGSEYIKNEGRKIRGKPC